MEWSPRNLGIIIVGFILTCIVFVMFPYSLYKGAKEHKRRTESKQKNLWIPDILFPYLNWTNILCLYRVSLMCLVWLILQNYIKARAIRWKNNIILKITYSSGVYLHIKKEVSFRITIWINATPQDYQSDEVINILLVRGCNT